MDAWPITRDKARHLGLECVMWNDLNGIPSVLRDPSSGREITRLEWEKERGYVEGEYEHQLAEDIEEEKNQRLLDMR